MEKTIKPSLSVILFTYNAENYIKDNLRSLFSQKFKDMEVILVDKYSKDKTKVIAKRFPEVRIFDAPIERSTQINAGVKKALGKYVFITAVDMKYHPDYLTNAFLKCEKESYDAIYTSVLTENNTFFGKCKALERECYVGDQRHETARFVKKETFLAVGGYDENLVAAEDYDFQRKLDKSGYNTGQVDVIAEYHLREEETVGEIIKRSFYYGKTFPSFLAKHKASAVSQMSPVRISFFKNWRLWVSDPVHSAGFIFYKSLQYLSGGAGLLYGMITNYSIKKNYEK